MRDLLGYEPDEVLGRTPFDFMTEAEVRRLTPVVTAHWTARRPFAGLENQNCRKDGGLVLLETSGVPVFDAAGVFRGYRGIDRDITERRRAEAALRVSDERFRQMFGHMSSGVAIYTAVDDGEDFVLQELNPAAERAIRRTRIEVAGRRVSEVFPDVKRFGLFEVLLRVWRTGTAETHPARFYRDARLEFWAENFVFRLPSGELVAIFDDITERVRADEQLRYQSSLLDQIRDTVTATDLEGRITYVNEAQCRALNRTREELVGAPLEVFGEDPARGATQREIVAATRATGHWRGEVVNRTRSGRQLLVEVRTAQIYDATGRPTGLCRVGTDITERKLAEEQRRRQEEEFRAFVETTNDWIWAIDLTGRHIYSNPAVTTILGYDATEVVGQEALILLHPDDQARARDLLQRKVDHKEGWSGLVLRWRHKNGSDPYLESTAVPVFDGQGDLVAFRGADRDVTDRMRAAAVLREREAKLTSIFRAAPVRHRGAGQSAVIRRGRTTAPCAMTGLPARRAARAQSARVLYPEPRGVRAGRPG